jgi:beta-galactosidase
MRLPTVRKGATLDILVEAMGRINFGRAIKDFKGIVGGVQLTAMHDGRPFVCDMKNWEVFPLPDELEFYASMNFEPVKSLTDADGHRVPGVYRGVFNVKKPADTFLDFSTWGKGLVYVNGHPLGRIWEIGPQQTLYTPGCWLKKGENEIVVFDIVGPRATTVKGHREPILDMLQQTAPGAGENSRLAKKLMEGAKAVAEGSATPGNGWQTIRFANPAKGRYLILEALSAQDGGDRVAVAEMYALGADGKRLSREPWTVVYADSEDTRGVNRTGDKVYDLQESTYWQTSKHDKFPHSLVLDLGSDETVTGVEILPRAESGAPHAIKDYRLYLRPAAAAK